MPRTQSPSSINTYKQCPRKYYYRYIKRLPTKPSIHLVRGTIVHSVLEDFFDEHPKEVTEDWRTNVQFHGLSLLKRYWKDREEELNSLDLTSDELQHYREETRRMVIHWLEHFCNRLESYLGERSFEEAFSHLAPKREAKYQDSELKVMGYIDAIEDFDEKVALIDYKTSKKPEITPEYRLQLGIYALMYLRQHDKVPDMVGVDFVRHERMLMDVNDELLLDAQFEIEQIHMLTQTDDIAHYPKSPSPLCNWCDYQEICFPSS